MDLFFTSCSLFTVALQQGSFRYCTLPCASPYDSPFVSDSLTLLRPSLPRGEPTCPCVPRRQSDFVRLLSGAARRSGTRPFISHSAPNPPVFLIKSYPHVHTSYTLLPSLVHLRLISCLTNLSCPLSTAPRRGDAMSDNLWCRFISLFRQVS